MSSKRYAAAASSEVASSAALSALIGGASAVEAALAGWLAQGGATSWALLSPVTLAVAGGGAGVVFIDGRARQPGKGMDRPLRYERAGDAPNIAKISVPATGAVLATANALFGARSSVVVGAGVKAAKKEGAELRAKLLSRFGSAPQRVLSESLFLEALLPDASRILGAMIGVEDLSSVEVEASHQPVVTTIAGREVLTPPWSTPEARLNGVRTEGIVAVDAQGCVAAIVIDAPTERYSLAQGELELPALASVIRKGVPKLRAGEPLPSPLAIAVVRGPEPSINAAVNLDGKIDETTVTALTQLGGAASRTILGGWIAAGRAAFARGRDG